MFDLEMLTSFHYQKSNNGESFAFFQFTVVPLFDNFICMSGVLLSEYFDSKGNDISYKTSNNSLIQKRFEIIENSASSEVRHFSFLVSELL